MDGWGGSARWEGAGAVKRDEKIMGILGFTPVVVVLHCSTTPGKAGDVVSSQGGPDRHGVGSASPDASS